MSQFELQSHQLRFSYAFCVLFWAVVRKILTFLPYLNETWAQHDFHCAKVYNSLVYFCLFRFPEGPSIAAGTGSVEDAWAGTSGAGLLNESRLIMNFTCNKLLF